MAEEQRQQEGQSQDDFERVQGFIRDQVKGYLDELRTAQPQQQQQQVPQTDAEQQARNRMLEEVLTPVVGPYINRAILTATDASDKVDFYQDHPEGVEYKAEIEKMFKELANQGRVVSRKDLYDVIVGREANSDFDKLSEKRQAKKKAQLEAAEGATDFGAALMGKAKNDQKWSNFEKLTYEEMEQALDGITF